MKSVVFVILFFSFCVRVWVTDKKRGKIMLNTIITLCDKTPNKQQQINDKKGI